MTRAGDVRYEHDGQGRVVPGSVTDQTDFTWDGPAMRTTPVWTLEVITHSLRDCLDHKPSFAEVRPLAIRAVQDLIRAGATVGDVAGGDDNWRFVPWSLTLEQAIERITRDLAERDTYPRPGHIGWLTFPD